MLSPPSAMATPMAIAIATIAHTVDSRPELIPESTVVAGPVRDDSAISWTGARSVEVKYSVRWLTTWASTKPMTTAPNTFQPAFVVTPASFSLPTYSIATAKVPRSEEHTSELQSLAYLVCRLLLEK